MNQCEMLRHMLKLAMDAYLDACCRCGVPHKTLSRQCEGIRRELLASSDLLIS